MPFPLHFPYHFGAPAFVVAHGIPLLRRNDAAIPGRPVLEQG